MSHRETAMSQRGAEANWVARFLPLVEGAYDFWLEKGEWPSTDRLQRDLDVSGYDINVLDAYRDLPQLGQQLRSLHPTTIVLQLRILAHLPQATPILACALQIIRRGIELYFDADTSEPELRSDDAILVERVGSEGALLTRAAMLVGNDHPSPFGGGSWGEESWMLRVYPPRAREFRGLTTLESYFDRQESIIASSNTNFVTADTAVVALVATAFVVMPFSEQWSPGVYDLIKRAVDSLRPEAQVSVYRADEISRPGKITDQIVDALRSADVIIADITGSNPNVMWELGYAQAYGKVPVIMNQAIEATPFDLHDWRQVVYSRTPTETDEQKLAAHVRDALTVQ